MALVSSRLEGRSQLGRMFLPSAGLVPAFMRAVVFSMNGDSSDMDEHGIVFSTWSHER